MALVTSYQLPLVLLSSWPVLFCCLHSFMSSSVSGPPQPASLSLSVPFSCLSQPTIPFQDQVILRRARIKKYTITQSLLKRVSRTEFTPMQPTQVYILGLMDMIVGLRGTPHGHLALTPPPSTKRHGQDSVQGNHACRRISEACLDSKLH